MQRKLIIIVNIKYLTVYVFNVYIENTIC